MTSTGATEPMPRGAPVHGGGVCLCVVGGPDAGRSFVLERGAVVVGKSSRCDFRLVDKAVSAQHVRIEVESTGIRVTDLGSTNGTLYLRSALVDAVLVHGAVISLGNTRLALRSLRPSTADVALPRAAYGGLLGESPAMQRLYALLARIEGSDARVLLCGETGVGKELVAREIHAHSPVSAGPWVVLDCGAIPAGLVGSALFGHVRGAFTGAHRDHHGVFERAHGGTLFLDEVGELPPPIQPALLRALEAGEVVPVGGQTPRAARPRIIAASNRNLTGEVSAGRFREDLFHRLAVIVIDIPPLRERREDVAALVRSFLAEAGQSEVDLPPDTMELLTTGYDWPGNVRELRNVMARVLVLGEVPEHIAGARRPDPAASELVVPESPFVRARQRVVDAFEREYLAAQLRRAEGNIARAARLAGLDRAYLKRMLKRHGLMPATMKRPRRTP